MAGNAHSAQHTINAFLRPYLIFNEKQSAGLWQDFLRRLFVADDCSATGVVITNLGENALMLEDTDRQCVALLQWCESLEPQDLQVSFEPEKAHVYGMTLEHRGSRIVVRKRSDSI